MPGPHIVRGQQRQRVQWCRSARGLPVARQRKQTGPTRDDVISVAKRLVASADDDELVASAGLVRLLIELAEKAPRPRGRQPVSRRAQVRESLVIMEARARKAELVAGGMRPEKAAKQAAEEAEAKLLGRRQL